MPWMLRLRRAKCGMQVLWQTRCEILEKEKEQLESTLDLMRQHFKESRQQQQQEAP